MFANLKKKLEEGSAVSPVGAERKAVTGIASGAAKAQNACYVHGEGYFSVFMPKLALYC